MKPTSIHTMQLVGYVHARLSTSQSMVWYGPLTSQFFYKQASYVQLSEELLMGPCVQQKVKLAQFMSLLLSFLLTCNKYKDSPSFKVETTFCYILPTTTTWNEDAHGRYMHLSWPVWQSGAALEHNIVILYLALHTIGRFNPIPQRTSSLVIVRENLHTGDISSTAYLSPLYNVVKK